MGAEWELIVWIVVLVALAVLAGGYLWRRRGTSGRRSLSPPPERPAGGPVVSGTGIRGPFRSESSEPEPPLEPDTTALEPSASRPTRYPIVLCHGYFGFSHVGVRRLRQEYFRGVRAHLKQQGHVVFPCRVSPAAGIARRAEQLAEQLERIEAPRVNLIAHSMGGLDARYAISRLGLAGRVASLTTIGTPHRGTPIADASTLLIGDWRNVRRLLDQLGANMDGLYDLTTQRMAEFNAAVTDAAGVIYASYVGRIEGGNPPAHPLLSPGYAYLARTAGDNDGLVPASSQRWGELLGTITADHWAQIGWSGNFDAPGFYAGLVGMLAARGM